MENISNLSKTLGSAIGDFLRRQFESGGVSGTDVSISWNGSAGLSACDAPSLSDT